MIQVVNINEVEVPMAITAVEVADKIEDMMGVDRMGHLPYEYFMVLMDCAGFNGITTHCLLEV